jgi:hypothetical protein
MEFMPLYGVDFSNNQSVFGSAPANKYPVIMENDGARHILPFAEQLRTDFMGDGISNGRLIVRNRTNINLMINEQQSTSNSGISFTSPILASKEVIVNVVSTTTGFVHGWIDYNRDGQWTSDEKIGNAIAVEKGLNQIRFMAPAGLRSGDTWSRWRLCDCSGNVLPTGLLNSGEIEDAPLVISSSGGSVSGLLWYDKNKNGIRDQDEEGLEGVTVWADLNKNGSLDSNEPKATTANNGTDTITSVPDGTIRIKPENKNAWILTNIQDAAHADVLVKELEQTSNVNFGFVAMATSNEDDAILPQEFRLGQNYPNPFNPSTVIPFELAEAGQVSISIYDVTGRIVKVLLDRSMYAGKHTIQWDATGIPSGLYFVKMEAGAMRFTSKMTLLK